MFTTSVIRFSADLDELFQLTALRTYLHKGITDHFKKLGNAVTSITIEHALAKAVLYH